MKSVIVTAPVSIVESAERTRSYEPAAEPQSVPDAHADRIVAAGKGTLAKDDAASGAGAGDGGRKRADK